MTRDEQLTVAYTEMVLARSDCTHSQRRFLEAQERYMKLLAEITRRNVAEQSQEAA